MRFYLKSAFVFMGIALSLSFAPATVIAQEATPTPENPLDTICKRVTTLPNGGYIYKNSAPLRNSRGALIGYRLEPTLIGKSRTGMSKGGTKIYDNEGTRIGSCPWATAHGFAGGRFRCVMQTASLRRKAVKNTDAPVVFFKTGTQTCVKVPDAGKCYGSSKGRCNQTLK